MMTKKIVLTLAAAGLFTAASAQKNTKINTTSNMELKNGVDSTSYALGVLIGKNLKSQGFDVINLDIFKSAIKDVFENKATAINETQCQTEVQSFAMEQQKMKAQKNLKEGQAFLEKNKTKPGVKVTASGLQYEVIKEGNGGDKPLPTSQVSAHYHGTLLDGTVFDSSVQRGQPFKTGVNQVIQAWQEALQLMTPGTKLRIYCPSNLAYGERGAGGNIGPNQVLIFEMELLSIDSK